MAGDTKRVNDAILIHLVCILINYTFPFPTLSNRIWVPSAVALATFVSYTLIAGERLTVSKAFTSLALFSHLQGSMTELPMQFMALLHGMAHYSTRLCYIPDRKLFKPMYP